jgi:hypothetical protein
MSDKHKIVDDYVNLHIHNHLRTHGWIEATFLNANQDLVDAYTEMCIAIADKLKDVIFADMTSCKFTPKNGNEFESITILAKVLTLMSESIKKSNNNLNYIQFIRMYMSINLIDGEAFISCARENSAREIVKIWSYQAKTKKLSEQNMDEFLKYMPKIMAFRNSNLTGIAKLHAIENTIDVHYARIAARCDQGQAPGPQV